MYKQTVKLNILSFFSVLLCFMNFLNFFWAKIDRFAVTPSNPVGALMHTGISHAGYLLYPLSNRDPAAWK